jgi:hypothetical protein
VQFVADGPDEMLRLRRGGHRQSQVDLKLVHGINGLELYWKFT